MVPENSAERDFISSYLQKIWNNFFFLGGLDLFVFIAISGNTALPALKLTVIKKAHE